MVNGSTWLTTNGSTSLTIKRVVLTGGGSGGHIYPLLAVKEVLSGKKPGLEFFYVGPKDDFSSILDLNGIKIYPVASSKIRRYASGILSNILDFPKFVLSVFQAFFRLYFLMPDLIFSKGGPGGFPVVLAGWFYRIPVVIHDSDAIPGLTNLLSARFAKTICVSFENAFKYFDPDKTILTGDPLRKEFSRRVDGRMAKEELGFAEGLPLTLFLGGSQGSRRLNDFLVVSLKELLPITQILHQTGKTNFSDVEKLARAELAGEGVEEEIRSRYKPVIYFEGNLNLALSACDLVVSRAGSSSIFEIAAFGKPAILIPLPESANDHQTANAYEFAERGGGIVIEEDNLKTGIFIHQLKDVLSAERKEAMSAASAKFAKPLAAEDIAEKILEILGMGASR